MKGNYLPETEGDYAVEFIAQHAKDEQPFFLYYAPLSVHTPLHEVPKKYLDRLYPGHEGKYSPRQQLRASLLAIDDQIGRIIDKLDAACRGLALMSGCTITCEKKASCPPCRTPPGTG